MIPLTDTAKRIAILFKRRLDTHWSEKEVKRYRQLIKDRVMSDEALELIGRYYAYQRKRENGIHRRDLYTFLNNFSGELDRARAWDEEMRERLKRKVRRPLDTEKSEVETNAEEWERISDLAKKEMDRFKNQMRMPA